MAEGPHSVEDVRRRYEAGEIPGSIMSWQPGETRWQSLERRWSRSAAGAILGVCAVLANTMLVAGLVVMGAVDVLPAFLRPFPVVATVSVSATVLAAIVATLSWRASVRRQGLPSVGARTCVLLVAVAIVWTIALISLHKRVQDDRLASGNATFAFDAASGELHVRGYIGDRFVPDLEGALVAHAAIRRLVIDSPGGLLVDAFEGGRLLRRLRIPVRVTGECASACVVVWASAAVREAAGDAMFGLHQSRVDGNFPTIWRSEAAASSDADISLLLKEVGFTEAMLAMRDKADPDDMYWIEASDMQVAGVQMTLVDVGP